MYVSAGSTCISHFPSHSDCAWRACESYPHSIRYHHCLLLPPTVCLPPAVTAHNTKAPPNKHSTAFSIVISCSKSLKHIHDQMHFLAWVSSFAWSGNLLSLTIFQSHFQRTIPISWLLLSNPHTPMWFMQISWNSFDLTLSITLGWNLYCTSSPNWI